MSPRSEAQLATPDHLVTSPTGGYLLELVPGEYSGDDGGGTFQRLRIRDAAGDVAHDSPKRFSARFATDVLWDDAVDRVWVYSSDVGTFRWDRDAEGGWTARALRPDEIADASPMPPALLVERHPDVFGPDGRAKAREVADRQRGMTDGPATSADDPRLLP